MGIGGSIFLIAVGLILALAVNVNVAGVDIHLVGWILTAVGVIGLLVTLVIWGRRRTVVEQPPRVVRDDYPPPY